jgi:subtilisin family serine protease
VYYGEISDAIVFDIVKAFHLQKPIGANGHRRPTVCTNSWGWRGGYPSSCTTVYRGTTYTHTGYNSAYGQVNYYHGVRIPSLDADVSDCIDAGVIMLGAAGNYYHKIDVPGGLDWDNTVNSDHYHRGSSPTAPIDGGSSMICVGALDNTSVEQKAIFSETGPGVSIYSAGVMTMAAYANKAYQTSAVPDARNSAYYINKLSGTSMATPNVAGVACLMAGMRPGYNNQQIRDWLLELSDKNTMTEGTAGYTNQRHLQGGLQRVLKWPYISENPFSVNNLVPKNGAKLGL